MRRVFCVTSDRQQFSIQELGSVKLNNLLKKDCDRGDLQRRMDHLTISRANSATLLLRNDTARLWRTSNFFLYVLYAELLSTPTNLSTTWHHVFIQVFYFPQQKKNGYNASWTRLVFFANHPPSSIYMSLFFPSILPSPSIGSLVQFRRTATCFTHPTAFIIINKYIVWITLVAGGYQAIDRPTDRSPAGL